MLYVFQAVSPSVDHPSFYFIQRIIPLIGAICMNLFKQPAPTADMPGTLMMINYYVIYFASGIVDQFNIHHNHKIYEAFLESPANVLFGAVFFLIFAHTCPQVETGQGFLFYFPIYDNFVLQSLFIAGSFFWVFTMNWLGSLMNKDQRKTKFYKITVTPTLWTYVSHYLWLVIVAVYVINEININIPLSVLVLFTLT